MYSAPSLSRLRPMPHSVTPSRCCFAQDASQGGSDSAEEVAWAPQLTAAAPAPSLDVKPSTKQDTSAAIDLLTMSIKDARSLALRTTSSSRPSSPLAAAVAAMPPLFTGPPAATPPSPQLNVAVPLSAAAASMPALPSASLTTPLSCFAASSVSY